LRGSSVRTDVVPGRAEGSQDVGRQKPLSLGDGRRYGLSAAGRGARGGEGQQQGGHGPGGRAQRAKASSGRVCGEGQEDHSISFRAASRGLNPLGGLKQAQGEYQAIVLAGGRPLSKCVLGERGRGRNLNVSEGVLGSWWLVGGPGGGTGSRRARWSWAGRPLDVGEEPQAGVNPSIFRAANPGAKFTHATRQPRQFVEAFGPPGPRLIHFALAAHCRCRTRIAMLEAWGGVGGRRSRYKRGAKVVPVRPTGRWGRTRRPAGAGCAAAGATLARRKPLRGPCDSTEAGLGGL